ncbi:MAG: polyphosphate polymerase domain-containing protein [Flavobacteriales bacterium]
MDRTDTKFLLSTDNFGNLLKKLMKDYHCLEVEGVRASKYETVYLDTEDLNFYIRHHNGKRNRYKVRFRTYVESALTFLEIKFKNNKSRTVKNRVIVPEIENKLSEDSSHFIKEISGIEYALQNVLRNEFRRITLVNDELRERLTLDLNLTFEAFGKKAHMGDVIICELKQEKAKRNSPFLKAVRSHRHKAMRISKYCMGIAMLKDGVKKNNFKENLLIVEKFNNDNRAA